MYTQLRMSGAELHTTVVRKRKRYQMFKTLRQQIDAQDAHAVLGKMPEIE